jgi:cytosine/uracil/thiamine/allantoin permease
VNLIKKIQSTRKIKKNKKESSLMTGPLAGKIAFFFYHVIYLFFFFLNTQMIGDLFENMLLVSPKHETF